MDGLRQIIDFAELSVEGENRREYVGSKWGARDYPMKQVEQKNWKMMFDKYTFRKLPIT